MTRGALVPGSRRKRAMSSFTGAFLLSSAVVLTGCGFGELNHSTPSTGALTLSGNLHGGQQAIVGATVNLYEAGTSGYGKGSTLLATYTTDSAGGFQFTKSGTNSDTVDGSTSTWACPTTGDPIIYLLAIGGNTQGAEASTTTSGDTTTTVSQSNTASVLLSVAGKCSTLSSSSAVLINELTTVAGVTAMQQYINPGSAAGSETIGTSSSTQGLVGLENAASTVPNLVNVASGDVTGVSTLTGNSLIVTVTPETSKIVTMANILAACINSTNGVTSTTVTSGGSSTTSTSTSSASICQDLMAAATPPVSASTTSQPSATFSAAVDTLQAAYYMATNPIDAGSVATCQSSTATTNIGCLFGLVSGTPPFGGGLSAAPTDWTIGINYANATTSTTACAKSGTFLLYALDIEADASGNIWGIGGSKGNVFGLSPSGTPLACVAGNYGSGRAIAIDTSGYIWLLAYSSGGIQRYDYSSGDLVSFGESGVTPYNAIAADGSGNIIYTTAGTVRELPAATSATAAVTGKVIGGGITTTPLGMAIDQTGRIWISDTSTTSGVVYDVYPDSNGTNGYSSVALGSSSYLYSNYGVAVDSSNAVWLPNSSSNNKLATATPTSTSTATFTLTAANAGGLSNPRGVAIDGAGNIWVPNAATAYSGQYSISEFNAGGSALSPTTTTSGSNNGGFQKATSILAAPRSITIDPSGNVWVGANTSTATSITEIVGAAVPVVMPLSQQLSAGTGPVKP